MLAKCLFLLLVLGKAVALPAPPITQQATRKEAVRAYVRQLIVADSLYGVHQYEAAATCYRLALQMPAVKPLAWHWYEAARSATLSGQRSIALSYLKQLLNLPASSYAAPEKWRSEAAFQALHALPEWPAVLAQADQQQAAMQQHIREKDLAAELRQLLQRDQALRQTTGALTPQQYQQFVHQDSVNLARFRQLFARYGWPGRDQVGVAGNEAAFLLAQHSDQAATIAQFLPAIRKSVEQGQTDRKHLAYLEDRRAMRLGRKQRYGTQFQFNEQTHVLETYPLENPAEVDVWRYEMNLPPLATYVRLAMGQ